MKVTIHIFLFRDKPCLLDDDITACVPTFGYKHVLDFTSDKDEFQV